MGSSGEANAGELNGILDRVTDAIYALDDEWKFTYVNDRAESLLSHTEEELRGECLWEVFPQAVDSTLHDQFQKAMETQEPVSFERYSESLDIWAEVQAYPSETGLSVYFRDITERKEHESELELFRTIIDQSNDAMFVIDPDTAQFIDVNDTACRRLGYERSELLDLTVLDIEEQLTCCEAWEAHVEEVQTESGLSFEGQHRRADGSCIPVEVNVSYVDLDRKYMFAVARDVTERKQRERELEESERRYRTLVEHFPNGAVALVDEELNYQTVGGDPVDVANVTVDEVEGAPVSDVLPSKLADALVPRYEAALAGESDDFEMEFGGAIYQFQVVPVRDESGEVFAALGMSQDITDRKERERERVESERRYRTLVDNFPNGSVGLFDENYTYDIVGGALLDNLGFSPDDVVGTTIYGRYPDELVDKIKPNFRAVFDGESNSFEIDIGDRDLFAQTLPVRNADDEIYAGMLMVQDVTERKERERELERALDLLERTERIANVGGWEIDPDTMDVFWTDHIFELLEVDSDEEPPLDEALDMYHEEDQPVVENAVENALDSGDSFDVEARIRTDSDEIRWLRLQGTPETNDGEIISFRGTAQDITEHKERERELERNNEQLETLFEVLPVGVVVAEANGEIVEANDTAHEIWGGDVFDADSVEEYAQYPVRWANTGEPVDPEEMTLARVVDGEEVTDPDILEIEAVDGEHRIIELEGMPIRDESGEVTRGVVTMSDVTERKEAQQQLEESERLYRTLAEHFPNGVVGVYDHDLRYTLAAGEKAGDPAPSPEEVEGTRMPELYPDDVVADLEPLFRAAIEDGETGSIQTTVVGRHWRVWATPLRDADGDIFAGLSFAQDITEQIEREQRLEELIEELEESNERLQQFAYAASHDLQEPLRMVSSYLQLLESRYADDLDQDAREFIEFAVDGADRMRAMIDALLEYSRVETRGDPFEPIDLNAVLEDVRNDLQMRIAESDAEITVEDLPRVEGDAGQLRQVFQNLLDNAIEYSGDEPPRIHVAAERCKGQSASIRTDNTTESGDRWLVSVSDNGIGIDPDDADRVFEVFQRLHSRDEHDGTGIGLALVERIVERHGGEVWVESEPGEGSTFRFTLPYVE
ncbi:PAS domain S-box protein [Halomicrobium salinisoli]|uniref:PAS domain S-box protein n=1 Tax=Halomicrobium salinisoli TaxID=2878391 RepID=UPI001CF05176|nr:PAS domain S-box protein [Halomicrobium salinisoli]